jgi:hypothetical protein
MNTTKKNPETPSGISKCGNLKMKEINYYQNGDQILNIRTNNRISEHFGKVH